MDGPSCRESDTASCWAPAPPRSHARGTPSPAARARPVAHAAARTLGCFLSPAAAWALGADSPLVASGSWTCWMRHASPATIRSQRIWPGHLQWRLPRRSRTTHRQSNLGAARPQTEGSPRRRWSQGSLQTESCATSGRPQLLGQRQAHSAELARRRRGSRPGVTKHSGFSLPGLGERRAPPRPRPQRARWSRSSAPSEHSTVPCGERPSCCSGWPKLWSSLPASARLAIQRAQGYSAMAPI